MDSFHKWSLVWEGVSCVMTSNLCWYLQGHLAMTLGHDMTLLVPTLQFWMDSFHSWYYKRSLAWGFVICNDGRSWYIRSRSFIYELAVKLAVEIFPGKYYTSCPLYIICSSGWILSTLTSNDLSIGWHVSHNNFWCWQIFKGFSAWGALFGPRFLSVFLAKIP